MRKFVFLFLLLSLPAFAMEVKEVTEPACVFKKEPISCGLVQALANKVKADEVKNESRFITKYTLKEI